MSSNMVPPGLPPPGLRGSSQNQTSKPPPGLSIPPPPGISLQKPPGLPKSSTFSDDMPSTSRRKEPEEMEVEGPQILAYDDVKWARVRMPKEEDDEDRGMPTKKHESDMSRYINGDKLFQRFEHPFVKITHNLDLLYVVNHAVSSRLKTVQSASKEILRGVFNREFERKLKKKFLDPAYAKGKWNDDSASLLFEIMLLYFHTARFQNGFMLTIDNFCSSWYDFVDDYQEAHPTNFSKAGVTDRELQNIDKLIKHIDKWVRGAKEAAAAAATVEKKPSISSISHDNRQVSKENHGEGASNSQRERESDSRRSNYSQSSSDFKSSIDKNAQRVEDRRREAAELEAQKRRHQEQQQRAQEAERRERELEIERYEAAEQERRRAIERRRAEEEERWRREEQERIDDEEFYREQEIRLRRRYEESRENGTLQNDGGVEFDEDGYPILDITDSFELEKEIKPEPENSQEQVHLPTTNCDAKPKQPYKYADDDEYEPPYMRCEKIDPPDDYKTLTSVPTLADYVNPTEPYLRRIQELGVYKSAHHYLDVQFRLLREDLVSPMRDGIDIYRKNGTCKGKRIEGAPCSDISVFNIERVDGKQVTEREGLEMRLIFPARFDIGRLLENDCEMKELGLVMLSCDQFEQDFHLGHIQKSDLIARSCLQLAIHEETRPFESNKSYQMAVATSYLPCYKHVLENMRTVNPFKPIPFERYIVHGKKDIYRPWFHRHEKTEDQIHEENRLVKIYSEIRSQSAAQRFMSGKPIPRGVDDDDDDDYFTVNTKAPAKEEQDLEYLQLQQPIFRQFIGADTKSSDLLLIDKKWFKISRLLDDFHPTNMDESQRRAYCTTFKHELSLIQGPPGTGKTHIGVEIVKTMLQNRAYWKMTEPILVVCFTNSGLDNLLERLHHMILNDEDLSKDNGKPKMIRYGAKCESDYLKRSNVMRFDVNEQYRNSVSDAAQREQSKAGANKRKQSEVLAISSYTLFCSRNQLLSYNVLHHVMNTSYQTELNNFSIEHVDTKENSLNSDEALACWLLDRDFGKATKIQTKKAKKSKFQEVPEEEEVEDRQFLTVEGSDDEDEVDMDDEEVLDKIFKKMNLECSGKEVLEIAKSSTADEYCTKSTWEILKDQKTNSVPLLGVKSKLANCSVDESINKLVQEVKEMILSTTPTPFHELDDVKYIFSLTRPKRWALYMHWCEEVRKLVVESLPTQILNYRNACARMQSAMDRVDAEIMKMPMIIGATTTGCSRLRPLLEQVEPRILIVEEAAEVLEAHILSAMISSVEHCVMIGDHKQLRPNPAVHELGVEYGMQISMFERLVERALPYSQLRQQHRMNVLISDTIVKPAFYDNVIDADNVKLYPDVEGMATNLYLWSHSKKEETPDGISWMNRHEAVMTIALIQHLLKQSYTPRDIVVLTTYAAQRNYMTREYGAIFGLESGMIPVHTVDSFQGRESKIVIVSLVRSHRGVAENTGIGFLAVANRICVALTRAQHGMYIIGNGAYTMHNSQLWNKIVGMLSQKRLVEYQLPLKCVAHGNEFYVTEPSDFAVMSPEGGCQEMCNIQKFCGHICRRRCHPNVEWEHEQRCQYLCEKECSNQQFKHRCQKMCSEDCGQCMRLVEVELQCGHRVSTPCSRIKIAKCDQLCEQIIPCGHRCSAKCGDVCIAMSQCQEIVILDLACGHTKPLKCGLLTSSEPDLRCHQRCENRMLTCDHRCAELCGEMCTLECQELVNVTLSCGHSQNVICSSYEPEQLHQIECTTLVTKKLQPCGHTEPIQCGKEPTTDMCTRPCQNHIKECNHICGNRCGECYITQEHLCQQRCDVEFECGHKCNAKCSDQCPPCKAFCGNNCEHQSCGSGEKDFGRECHMVCAMCIRNCANKCIHRSCTMKCYEECDVKTCAEPCTEKLRCGHACLGMCGEKCPKICGTCERTAYLNCVSGSMSQRVHRLIMIPKCHHIFPVEQLDEHVKMLKDQGKPLKCPTASCNASLIGILRYAKYNKKYFVEENLKKLKSRVRGLHQSTYETRLRETLASTFEELQHVGANLRQELFKIVQKFRENIQEVVLFGDEFRVKSDQKWRLAYLCDIAKCYWAIARLLSTTSKQQILRRKDIPPNTEALFYRCFGDMPFRKVLEELKRVNDHIEDTFKTFLSGAILPKLRMLISRMALYQLMSSMCYQLCLEKRDISDSEAKTLGSSSFAVVKCEEHNDFVSKLEIVEASVVRIAPKLLEGRKVTTWSMLNMPDL